jgi:glycosyltransferase involved in cell wall biosynthesis
MTPVVIVPAHDEADGIARLLHALQPLDGSVQVVVVCNGCSDDTASIARAVAPLAVVVEIEQGSKPLALNVGDQLAHGFPRAYVDADCIVTATDLLKLFEAVETYLAAAPEPMIGVSGSSRMVKAYYLVRSRLGVEATIAGTGVIVLSEQGRARFGVWPPILADDYFVDGCFSVDEKSRISGARSIVEAPTNARQLVSRLARVHEGMGQAVAAGLRPRHPRTRLADVLRLPFEARASVSEVMAYLAVTLGSRVVRLWRRRRGTSDVFVRGR